MQSSSEYTAQLLIILKNRASQLSILPPPLEPYSENSPMQVFFVSGHYILKYNSKLIPLYNEDELEILMTHELTHIQKKDYEKRKHHWNFFVLLPFFLAILSASLSFQFYSVVLFSLIPAILFLLTLYELFAFRNLCIQQEFYADLNACQQTQFFKQSITLLQKMEILNTSAVFITHPSYQKRIKLIQQQLRSPHLS